MSLRDLETLPSYAYVHIHAWTQIFQDSDLFDSGSGNESDDGTPPGIHTSPRESLSPGLEDMPPKKQRKSRGSSTARERKVVLSVFYNS